MNNLIVAINDMRLENSETDLLELATEHEHSVLYAEPAVNETKKYIRHGIIPEKGSQSGTDIIISFLLGCN